MRRLGLAGVMRGPKFTVTTIPDTAAARPPDLVTRQFTAVRQALRETRDGSHAPAAEAAVTGVAHVSEEPRPGSDRVGFLHGPDRDLSSVCARGVEPRAAPAAAFQYHGASDRRVDGATTDRGVRAGGQPSVSDPGSGPGLWRTIFAPGQDVGHPGDGHSATIAVAKRLCRARDWLDSTRMSGPYRGNR